MARFSESFYLPERPETFGATLNSARQLVDLGEECILLQATHTERAIGQIAALGEYAGYTDIMRALEHRYVREDPPEHSLNPDQIDTQATLQWKRYIETLRPELHGLIQEFNHSLGIVDPMSGGQHLIPAKWFSRSLVYRTIISRNGLESLHESKVRRRMLGKQTVLTLEALLAILHTDEGDGEN